MNFTEILDWIGVGAAVLLLAWTIYGYWGEPQERDASPRRWRDDE